MALRGGILSRSYRAAAAGAVHAAAPFVLRAGRVDGSYGRIGHLKRLIGRLVGSMAIPAAGICPDALAEGADAAAGRPVEARLRAASVLVRFSTHCPSSRTRGRFG